MHGDTGGRGGGEEGGRGCRVRRQGGHDGRPVPAFDPPPPGRHPSGSRDAGHEERAVMSSAP